MPVTADNWNVNADGDWSVAGNWSLGTVPTSNNSVSISTPSVHTITHSTGNDVVSSLTVGSTDHFVFSGGSLEILTTASFGGGYVQTGGTLNAHAVSITGPGTLTGGGSTGSTSFTISGTIALANYTLGGASVLNNASATNETGQITLGDNTGINATINNASGGVYTIAGDYGIGAGATSAKLVNTGTLDKSAGSGTSTIAVNTTSTGTVEADSGNLEITGATNSIKGSLTGAGQVSFGGAGVTTLATTTNTVGALGLYDTATLNLGATITYAGVFTDASFGTTTLNLGTRAFRLTGASNSITGTFGRAIVTGSGTFTNSGTLSLSNVTLGGTVTFNNAKVLSQTGSVIAGDGTGNVPTITNTAAGTYNLAADTNLSLSGSGAATFNNQGILAKTAGNGTSDISLVVTSSKTISAQTGILQFDNSLTNTGAINGAGAIEITGTATLNAGTVLNVATFDLFSAATLNLGTSLSYAGVFNATSSGTSHINLGSNTFTLSGASNTILGQFGSAIVSGSGTLANSGTLTFGNAILGGTATLANTGTVNQSGTVTAGDGSGNVPAITNAGSGVYDFVADVSLLQNNAAVAFNNQGLLEKTGGTGTSDVALAVTNTGTITAQTGILQFDNVLTNAGTIGGSAAVEITGTANLNAGTVLSVSTLDLFGTGTLNIGTSLGYAGVFNDSSGGTNTINLGANTFTLSGATNTIAGAFGSAVVTGTGTLANTGTLTLSNALVGATASINNTGTVNQTGNVTIGGTGVQVASIVNAATGTYNLASGLTIGDGASAASHFDNAGQFNVLAGAGQSDIATTFNNQAGATLTISTGFLANDATLINAGTIAGTRLDLAGASTTTLNRGSRLTVGEIDLYASSTLNVGVSTTYAGTFNDGNAGTTTINLANTNLVLTGASTFNPNFGVDLVTGSGTLKLAHASQFIGGTTEIGGTAKLEVAAALTVIGSLQLGDNTVNAASAVIDANGTYNLQSDNGISRGAALGSTLTNNGLFEKTAGTGTSVVSSAFVNNGTITVTSGTVEFLAGTLTGNGTINGVKTTDSNGNIFITHS